MMQAQHLHVDIETYSDVDLVTSKCGVCKYAKHPSTEITLISYALGDAQVQNIDLTNLSNSDEAQKLAEFLALARQPKIIKWAHNAQFEKTLFQFASNSPLKGEINLREWRCTMVLAHCCSLMGALSHVGDVLRLPEKLRKLSDGSRLIRKFCKPRTLSKEKPYTRCTRLTDPRDWALFIQYCNNDVEAEREVHRRLDRWDLPAHEWDYYYIDQAINERGLPVDIDLVDSAIKLADSARAETQDRIRERFGISITSPAQVLNWLNSKGRVLNNTRKETLVKELKDPALSDEIRDVINARLDANKTSIKKFHALAKATEDDLRVRGCFQFAGASRTWRWAGRIFQPQNIARGSLKPHQIPAAKDLVKSQDVGLINLIYGSPNELLPSLIRPAITAPKGKKLVVADLASIETIMLGWAAKSEYMLDLFRKGLDPYKDYATHLYNCEYDEVTKAMRTYAKPPTLGCGYMLGAKGLVAYADGYGVALTEAEAKKQVDTYRTAYPDVVDFWSLLDVAAKRCIRTGRPQRVTHFEFTMDGPFMRVSLPSGRSLSYLRPRIEKRPAPWDKNKLIDNVVYEGMDQDTKKWCRISTHAGKFTENLIQAIARDVLAWGLSNAESDPRLDVVGHVHDEIIALADENDDSALTRLISHMTTLPDWCPDLPIKAEGYESPFYMKD